MNKSKTNNSRTPVKPNKASNTEINNKRFSSSLNKVKQPTKKSSNFDFGKNLNLEYTFKDNANNSNVYDCDEPKLPPCPYNDKELRLSDTKLIGKNAENFKTSKFGNNNYLTETAANRLVSGLLQSKISR